MKRHLGLILAAAACALPARADLTWEHSGTAHFTGMKKSVFKFKVFSNMTPQRYRLMFKYDATAMGAALPGGMPPGLQAPGVSAFAPLRAQTNAALPNSPLVGTMTLVQRFDDGQMLGYTSLSDSYMSEKIQDVMTKYRFDPWKSLAPKLSKNDPPSLTPEQRARLGSEVRALLMPFMGSMLKTYFRPLPDKKTINGIEGNGYRMTMLVNTERPFSGNSRWIRASFEWWVAGELQGDQVVAQMREAAIKLMGREPKSSTSMWLNELPRVMFEMMPEEIHNAVYTVMPRPDAPTDSPEWKRANTPLAMTMSLKLPPGMEDKMGELRVAINLVRRGEEALPARIFEAPEGYKRVPLDDLMKEMEKARGGLTPPMPGF